MGCRIYLVRHGATEWNELMRFQGHADIPLSELGRRQADLLGKRLSVEKFEGFYASDLNRAVETAKIISGYHGIEVVTLHELREINFGFWEGMTFSEIRKTFENEFNSWWERPLTTRIPGGETLSEVVERSVSAIKRIVECHPDGNVAVVTHGGAIRSIVGSVIGMDLNKYWRLRQDNACLNIVDFPEWEKGILTLLNDCSHLENNI